MFSQRAAVRQVQPEGDAELAAGFLQTGKGIAALTAQITARTSADFALFHEVTDIGLAPIGMHQQALPENFFRNSATALQG